MKIYILTLIVLAAFASACTTNTVTPANKNVSNSNSSNNDNAAGKTEKPVDSARKSERVEFTAGKTETNLTRPISANGSIDFVLNARSGQRMQYSVIYDKGSDTDIEVFLTEPGLQDISNTSAANENNEFIIKKTGDHRITVNNTTGSQVTVRFGLSIK